VKEINIKNTQINGTNATNAAWELEARALLNINRLEHPNITKCIAAIRRGDRRYFMFPWADGDSLRDYWDRTPRQRPNAPHPEMVLQAIEQLRGVAEALHVLHNCDSGAGSQPALPEIVFVQGENNTVTEMIEEANETSIRHGDLKPENILRFLDPRSDHLDTAAELGTLKIADMGLAKQHVVATQLREKITSQRYGTIRYEAPEAVTAIRGRSRLYDVWSMGCITLEFIVWLLHGNEMLQTFYAQVGGDARQTCQYFEIPKGSPPQIHSVVGEWLQYLKQSDPDCSQGTALGDLLKVVQSRLLVIELDPNGNSPKRKDSTHSRAEGAGPKSLYRATALEFRDELDTILQKAANGTSKYLRTGKSRDKVILPIRKQSSLSPADAELPRIIPMHQKTASPPALSFTGVMGRNPRTEYSVSLHRCLAYSTD
jgi:serine/threonine protein kinase